MMRIFSLSKTFAVLVLGLGLSGCFVNGKIEDLTEATKIPFNGQQSGLVSGSTQNEVVNGYKVSTSVGHYANGIQETVNGYTVYVGLQGSVSSDVFQEAQ